MRIHWSFIIREVGSHCSSYLEPPRYVATFRWRRRSTCEGRRGKVGLREKDSTPSHMLMSSKQNASVVSLLAVRAGDTGGCRPAAGIFRPVSRLSLSETWNAWRLRRRSSLDRLAHEPLLLKEMEFNTYLRTFEYIEIEYARVSSRILLQSFFKLVCVVHIKVTY